MNFAKDQLNDFVQWFDRMDDNPWFMAMMVILGNIGLHYIADDFDHHKREFFRNVYVRRLILFSIIFCATKNFRVSLIATICYSVALILMTNEKKITDYKNIRLNLTVHQ